MVVSKISIKFTLKGIGVAYGELRRVLAPMTFKAITQCLPIMGTIGVWINSGIFVPIGIKKGLEKAVKEVDAGTIAYWPVGDALCIFYKKSTPYSSVNVVGKITDGLEIFENARRGTRIIIEKVDEE